MSVFKDIYLEIFSKNHDLDNLLSAYIAEEVNVCKNVMVGISADGHPSILIVANDEDVLHEDIPSLSGIEARFGVNCEISIDNEIKPKRLFTILTFIEEDRQLRDFFFNFFEDLFKEDKNKTSKKIRSSIINLSKLFSHRKKESRKTMMGLWSELLIILLAEDSDLWAEKWHSQNRATFDFEFDNKGLDVKSFGGHNREHKFQIEQLNNESVEQTLILSMCLKESDSGLTVFDVLNKINIKIKKDSNKLKISKLLFSLAGKKITNSTRFNFDIAVKTLILMRGIDIPKLNPKNTPLGVSEIKFKADCSNVKSFKFHKKIQDKMLNGKII